MSSNACMQSYTMKNYSTQFPPDWRTLEPCRSLSHHLEERGVKRNWKLWRALCVWDIVHALLNWFYTTTSYGYPHLTDKKTGTWRGHLVVSCHIANRKQPRDLNPCRSKVSSERPSLITYSEVPSTLTTITCYYITLLFFFHSTPLYYQRVCLLAFISPLPK